MRIAALADIHCNKNSHDTLRSLFSRISESADVVLLCGDSIDYGLPEEAAIFAKQIAAVKIPILAVLGNHEFESGKQDDVKRIFSDAGVVILDGAAHPLSGDCGFSRSRAPRRTGGQDKKRCAGLQCRGEGFATLFPRPADFPRARCGRASGVKRMRAKAATLLNGSSKDSFYRLVIEELNALDIPYLVGGGHALEIYSASVALLKT